ncbi:MAG: alpha/beta hydrolase [Actinobacteria bacterium]|nr:alpha/beta hydrolase [Actinomycetota bacterium]
MLTALLAAAQAEPVIAVGHDYGAPICVTLAHLNPTSISGLVLAAGNLFTDTPIPAPLKAATMPILGNPTAKVMFSGPMLRMMLRIGVGRPRIPLDPAVYLGDGGQRRTIATIFTAALRELPDRYREVEVALKGLHQPTVILWGDRDPFLGVEQAHRARAGIPNAHLRIERNAGHFLPAERPAGFIGAVKQVDRVRKHPAP